MHYITLRDGTLLNLERVLLIKLTSRIGGAEIYYYLSHGDSDVLKENYESLAEAQKRYEKLKLITGAK